MRKKEFGCKCLCLLLLFGMVGFILSGCGKKREFDLTLFEKNENTIEATHSFSTDDASERVRFDADKLREFRETVEATAVEKTRYDGLFDYETAIAGIDFDHSVAAHRYSALDENGELTKEHLFEIVCENTPPYIEENFSYGFAEEVSDDLLLTICEIVTDVINETLARYPDIDRERVYCNLGNMKVIEKAGIMDFAAIEAGMVMHVNRNTAETMKLMSDHNMYNTIVHEAMHIIQYGCECEELGECTRRAGLAHYYEEHDQSDWTWLAEGSAERMADLYANVDAMTYTTMVNYILTFDLATVLDPKIPANYTETLCFYSELDRLYEMFDAETETEKEEVYRAMYAMQVIQMEPQGAIDDYERLFGEIWTEDVRSEVNIWMKRPMVQTITKRFFVNLASAIENNAMTRNDLFFLLNLYDSTVNVHIDFEDAEYDEPNALFVPWYRSVREALFDCVENATAEEYALYSACDDGIHLNAGMQWLETEKRDFLIEKFEDNLCDFKFT